jgi:hypothetical protein
MSFGRGAFAQFFTGAGVVEAGRVAAAFPGRGMRGEIGAEVGMLGEGVGATTQGADDLALWDATAGGGVAERPAAVTLL